MPQEGRGFNRTKSPRSHLQLDGGTANASSLKRCEQLGREVQSSRRRRATRQRSAKLRNSREDSLVVDPVALVGDLNDTQRLPSLDDVGRKRSPPRALKCLAITITLDEPPLPTTRTITAHLDRVS